MLLNILIPTYNRVNDLNQNLNDLTNWILEKKLFDRCSILVSDNNSIDNTPSIVNKFISKYLKKIRIIYYRNKINIGLEPNMVSVLSKADARYRPRGRQ